MKELTINEQNAVSGGLGLESEFCTIILGTCFGIAISLIALPVAGYIAASLPADTNIERFQNVVVTEILSLYFSLAGGLTLAQIHLNTLRGVP